MIRFQRLVSARYAAASTDHGFTLVEMLVALVVSSVLAGVLLALMVTSERSADTSTQLTDLTAEARSALNRMSADLQQAVSLSASSDSGTTNTPAITAVANPDGPDYDADSVTSVTFNLDANGDGCIAGIASDNISPVTSPAPTPCTSTTTSDPNNPETETFCWIPPGQTGGGQLYLLATSPSAETTPVTNCGSGTPLLAGKVSGFEIDYRSSLYIYQNASGDDPQAGITTWYDLDSSGPPVGNSNDSLDLPELQYVDSVVISLTMTEGGRSRDFQTGVSLRNVHPND